MKMWKQMIMFKSDSCWDRKYPDYLPVKSKKKKKSKNNKNGTSMT